MNRREFTGAMVGALITGSAAASPATQSLVKHMPLLSGQKSVPCQETFRSIQGFSFEAAGLGTAHMQLDSVEVASTSSDKQFYLRFNATRQDLPEGIYELRHGKQNVALYLTPVTEQAGMMEAIVNTQTA